MEWVKQFVPTNTRRILKWNNNKIIFKKESCVYAITIEAAAVSAAAIAAVVTSRTLFLQKQNPIFIDWSHLLLKPLHQGNRQKAKRYDIAKYV